jgi:hypothetical protein
VRRALFVAVLGAALWLAPGALASGWCGTGEAGTDLPDVATGQQMHAIVVVPADGTDSFGTVAQRLADDVTTMTTWWTGQDPTRVPRFDLATFGGSTCLDISFMRLPSPASAYAGIGASPAWQLVAGQLESGGFANEFKNYYVYFDGPSVQANICGTGAGTFDRGPGYAIVWLGGCNGAHADYVGTHELLHALGAVPAGAPHFCDQGHVCDSQRDLMFSSTYGQPLTDAVLDVGRDDYYGHNGSWTDIQDSVFLHRLDVPPVALGVTFAGAAGRVTSDLPGLDCSAACTTQWDPGTSVTLTAQPPDTSRFVDWTGACTGPETDCTVQLTQAASVTALFGPLAIPLRVSVAGKGRVACSPACTKTFNAGDSLTLRAVPAKGWRFSGWSGACKGTRLVCSPPTDFALTVRATFKKKR